MKKHLPYFALIILFAQSCSSPEVRPPGNWKGVQTTRESDGSEKYLDAPVIQQADFRKAFEGTSLWDSPEDAVVTFLTNRAIEDPGIREGNYLHVMHHENMTQREEAAFDHYMKGNYTLNHFELIKRKTGRDGMLYITVRQNITENGKTFDFEDEFELIQTSDKKWEIVCPPM